MTHPRLSEAARYLGGTLLLVGGWQVCAGGGMLASGFEFAPHPWAGLIASVAGTEMAVLSYLLVRSLRWELPFRAGLLLLLSLLAFGFLLVVGSSVIPLLRGLTNWEWPLSWPQKVYAFAMSGMGWACLTWLYRSAGLTWRPKPPGSVAHG